MKPRQAILSWFYPILLRLNKLTSSRSAIIKNQNKIAPPKSIYELNIVLNNGSTYSLENAKGKKLLIVNTASDCGYTQQYGQLQKLYGDKKDNLSVIGFPANDFKEQEKGNDESIAAFCTLNFGVTFPLAKKSSVVKNENQNPVFEWLSDKRKNGWCDKEPSWNFSKYLLNENGVLTHYFDPAITPDDAEFLRAIEE